MKLYKRITYYFFGVLIGSMIVYFITSQKKTTFNYFPQERVIGDLKKKELVFDSSFNQNLKNGAMMILLILVLELSQIVLSGTLLI